MEKISNIILIFFFAISVSFAQIDMFSQIKENFSTGNTAALSASFGNNVTCEILGKNNFYSRSQLTIIFKDFFSTYKPKAFEIRHQKIEKNGRIYLIGIYTTQADEVFRVTIYAKQENETEIYITQIKIESIAK
ncbi:MAG: DUF4783 domain-containing protein [Prevotellaceae bacterium]|jgi:hypothetical protein|nr:DUF4783 domain-containing protein [Prevotellaceae bacterium]